MNKRLPDPVMKALLLCAHADELSRQCTIALRHGVADNLLDFQVRKHTILEALTATTREHALAECPELRRAVERLQGNIKNEMLAVMESAQDLQSQLVEVRATQRRLTDVRQYGRGSDAHLSPAAPQLAVCG